jgi:hypothetical protein
MLTETGDVVWHGCSSCCGAGGVHQATETAFNGWKAGQWLASSLLGTPKWLLSWPVLDNGAFEPDLVGADSGFWAVDNVSAGLTVGRPWVGRVTTEGQPLCSGLVGASSPPASVLVRHVSAAGANLVITGTIKGKWVVGGTVLGAGDDTERAFLLVLGPK